MKNIFEALEIIKVKPELYLGSKNLTYLYHYINGYLHKSINCDDNLSERIHELHFWLPQKTGIEIENWLQNLLLSVNHDEQKGLEIFFLYLELFKEEIIDI